MHALPVPKTHTSLSLAWHNLPLVLAIAFTLRLLFVLATPPNISGGDTVGLMQYGLELVRGQSAQMVNIPPLYLIYVGVVQVIFGEASLTALRLLNVLWSVALVGTVYAAANAYFGKRAALIAAWLVAINPIFIIEAGQVLTESVFLPLLIGAVALHGHLTRRGQAATVRQVVWVGVLLGLASLTRAIALALPVIFAAHLLWCYRRRALRLVAVLMVAYALVVLSWTAYGYIRWGTFMIGGAGLAANFYLGTNEGWCGPECVDRRAGIGVEDEGKNDQIYTQLALEAILSDPLGYVARRLGNLLEASLQPHNTVFFGGESLKELVMVWWTTDRSVAGFGNVLNGDAFLPKLTLYLFHFGALLVGALGVVLGILRWRLFWQALPLYGVLFYFYALHSLLTAIPRYLFPTAALWLIFAGAALAGRTVSRNRDEQTA
jgi:4-amino-4-deoxy-L-arabinose transferase-like glycosyltransferase